MHLYNLTLSHPTPATQTLLGPFGTKQAVVVANGTNLQLYNPNPETGRLELIFTQSTFAVINKIALLQDFIIATSDSGCLSVFRHTPTHFESVFQHPFGKNGFGRTVPGEYLAVDPHNRAVFVGAIERSRLVYRVEQKEEEQDEEVEDKEESKVKMIKDISLSSPIEVNAKNTLILTVTALYTGYENPIFCTLETEYSSNSISLIYYEVDMGLNHVTRRKCPVNIPLSANHLIAMPLGGVIICCENEFLFYNGGREAQRWILPLRSGTKSTIIVAHTVHKLKKSHFVMAQTHLGDLLKIEHENDFHVSYFDTVPVATSLNILKSGFLFVNTAEDDSLMYQFESLGDGKDNLVRYQREIRGLLTDNENGHEDGHNNGHENDHNNGYENDHNNGDNNDHNNGDNNNLNLDYANHDEDNLDDVEGNYDDVNDFCCSFSPQPLENLALVSIVDSLCPTISAHVDGSAIVSLLGHHLKRLVRGTTVETLVELEIPIIPTNIFTTRKTRSSPQQDYLVLSLDTKTLVLSMGEVIEEVEDSQFLTDQPTIDVQQVGKTSIVQITRNSIRHIRHGDSPKVSEWHPPAGITITQSSTRSEQVLVALSNNELVYFEIDSTDDQLIEYQDRLEVLAAVTAVSVGSADKKAPFAVVALADETIQVISLQPHNCLATVSMQALLAPVTSLIMSKTAVHIGMANGVYVRTMVDSVTGEFADTRIKYLGAEPVRLVEMGQLVLALSSTAWVCHEVHGALKYLPLLDVDLVCGTQCDVAEDAVVGLTRSNSLTIFTLGEDGFDPAREYKVEKVRLRYTPRAMDIANGMAVVIQSQYGVKIKRGRKEKGEEKEEENKNEEKKKENEEKNEENEENENENDNNQNHPSPFSFNLDLPSDELSYYEAFGYPPSDSWASCIQVVDLTTTNVLQSIEFLPGHLLTAVARVTFKRHKDQEYIVVASSTNQRYMPNSCDESFLHTYAVTTDGTLQYVHSTSVGQTHAMIPFNGRLLVASENQLFLYELGRKQLLRKSVSTITYLSKITGLCHMGQDRVVLSDIRQSTVYAKYDVGENVFEAFADDITKRQVTSMACVDYDTIVGGDKFGNVFVNRLPEDVSTKSDTDWTLLRSGETLLNGSVLKSELICEFYVGDLVTHVEKGSLGGEEVVVYFGIQGTVGILVPMVTTSEVGFLMLLEQSVRRKFVQDAGNILGKDHAKFRLLFAPVRNVVDGDFVERFFEMSTRDKVDVARDVKKTPREVERKLGDLANRV